MTCADDSIQICDCIAMLTSVTSKYYENSKETSIFNCVQNFQ